MTQIDEGIQDLLDLCDENQRLRANEKVLVEALNYVRIELEIGHPNKCHDHIVKALAQVKGN